MSLINVKLSRVIQSIEERINWLKLDEIYGVLFNWFNGFWNFLKWRFNGKFLNLLTENKKLEIYLQKL